MTPHSPPSVSLPVNLVADLQDSLLMAMTDLKRLEGLLDHATGNLLERFSTANHALGNLASNKDTDDLLSIRHSLHQAVTELQFHDMATQLIVHTGKVLQVVPGSWPTKPWRPRKAKCRSRRTPCPTGPAP